MNLYQTYFLWQGICWVILSVTISSYVTQMVFEKRWQTEIGKHEMTTQYLALPYFFTKFAELSTQIFGPLVYTEGGKEFYILLC